MKNMPRTLKLLVWAVCLVSLLSACSTSTDDSSGPGATDATKPPPQVRVELLPTLTPLPVTPTEVTTNTPEPTVPVQIYIDPPADEYAVSDQVEASMDDLERSLNQLDNELK